MSREIRRVPVGWKHPVEFNPYWESQDAWRHQQRRPASRLRAVNERFRGLMNPSLSEAIADWENGKAEWEAGTHESLLFKLKYHDELGYLEPDGTRSEPRPLAIYAEDGNTVVRSFFPKSLAELQEACPYESEYGDRPQAGDYMPDFDEPEDERGWCLYETVSEGTPCTPVFSSAEELIEHLVTVGQDYEQVPMRHASAESIVRSGGTFGSMMVVGGEVLRSDVDADRIDELSS